MSDHDYTQDPVRYGIYKGMGGKNGAIQFNLIKFDPSRQRDGKPKPEGFILVEASPTIGKNIYDWSNKIKFAMSPEDIARFLIFSRKDGKIFHQYGGKNKTLELRSGYEDRDGFPTWLLSLNEWSGDQDRHSINIPISAVEMTVLKRLLETAIPTTMGWNT